jgi:hypothetical protein
MSTSADEETTTWGQLCDIVRYAPIGVLLDGPSLLPELAEKGKAHVRNAHVLGQVAVREAESRLRPQVESLVPRAIDLLRLVGVVPTEDTTVAAPATPEAADTEGTSPAGADVTVEPSQAEEPVASAQPSAPAADELAIPDYESLSASQVVNRLPGLSAEELEAVRQYEVAHRGRKTILNKVAQLQG